MSEIRSIPVRQIVPGQNDRVVFDRAALEELAASIAAHGLAQPITVRPLQSADMFGQPDPSAVVYQIVAGERRFRAIRDVLQWDVAPCIVRDLDDEAASAIMLAENTGRADLNPIEEANAYQARIDRFGWTVEHIAKVAGVSTDLVKRRLSLLKLAGDLQHLVAVGQLPIGHAEAMTVLDRNRQMIALRIFRESKNGLPLSHFRPIVGQLLEEQSQESLFGLETFWVQQVQSSAELPTRGKRAVTGAPTRSDLPTVTLGPTDSTAAVIDRWIAELLATGHEAEAAVAGTLYTALVRGNFMTVPNNAALLSD